MSGSVEQEVRTSVRALVDRRCDHGCARCGCGFRSSTGALLEPLEEAFGCSRATTSGAVSLNLIVYGLATPCQL